MNDRQLLKQITEGTDAMLIASVSHSTHIALSMALAYATQLSKTLHAHLGADVPSSAEIVTSAEQLIAVR